MNLDIIYIVAYIILVGLTFWYSISTYKIVKVNEKIIRENRKPYIVVDIDFLKIPFLDFIIKNIGNGPAYNIRFNIEPDIIYYKSEYKLSELPIFQEIKYMPPNKEYRFFAGNSRDLIEDKQFIDYKFIIEVEYKDIFNEVNKNRYEIDLSKYKNLIFRTKYDISDIYKLLEDFNRYIRDLKTYIKDIIDNGINTIEPIEISEIYNSNDELENKIKDNLSISRATLDIITFIIDNYSSTNQILYPFPSSFELFSLLRKIAIKINYFSNISTNKVYVNQLELLSKDLFNLTLKGIINKLEVSELKGKIDDINKKI